MNFLITGLPRSGTAWLANWFTTDYSTCWHEALTEYSLEELARVRTDGLFGVSETSVCCLDPAEVNALPIPKLIVHRPLEEVNRSLVTLGLPGAMTNQHVSNLKEISGTHIDFRDLFDLVRFRAAHERLVPLRFNAERFRTLSTFVVENHTAVMRCLGVLR